MNDDKEVAVVIVLDSPEAFEKFLAMLEEQRKADS